ncbi:Pentachlorophenol monooxygenase [Planctomycetales bacterium 10988]|nr:Pentachlorophenol monooxygenase [Planctomycetales bacterium 10988]
MADQDPTVLVVGAGPTGLTAAIELARRGIPVRIIEKRLKPSTLSKAFAVHARTLELLDLVGIADEMVKRGYTAPGIDFSDHAEHPLKARMYGLDTRYPFLLILPQAKTEQFLERRLNREGIEVERGRELKHFIERDHHFSATIESHEGETETIDSEYIIGADGSHSTVRQILDIPFPGSKYSWTAFLGDCLIEGYQAGGGLEQHSNERGLALTVSFEDGWHRIVTIDWQHQDDPRTDELTLEDLQDSLSSIIGKPVQLREPRWLARWGADLRLAERYRSGRVFLAGDATHTHSPAGGQGMNTGIQDAFNLAWKIALVAKGTAPESLLKTYEEERRPIGKQVLRLSNFLLHLLLIRNRPLRTARQLLLRMLIPFRFVQNRLATNLSGLGIEYPQESGGIMAGRRMPDMQFMTSENQIVRLYDLLRFPGYTLLIYLEPREVKKMEQHLDRLAELVDDSLQVHILLSEGMPQLHSLPAEMLIDYRGDFDRKLNSKSGRVLFIRPDSYVAFDHPKLTGISIEQALTDWKKEANLDA